MGNTPGSEPHEYGQMDKYAANEHVNEDTGDNRAYESEVEAMYQRRNGDERGLERNRRRKYIASSSNEKVRKDTGGYSTDGAISGQRRRPSHRTLAPSKQDQEYYDNSEEFESDTTRLLDKEHERRQYHSENMKYQNNRHKQTSVPDPQPVLRRQEVQKQPATLNRLLRVGLCQDSIDEMYLRMIDSWAENHARQYQKMFAFVRDTDVVSSIHRHWVIAMIIEEIEMNNSAERKASSDVSTSDIDSAHIIEYPLNASLAMGYCNLTMITSLIGYGMACTRTDVQSAPFNTFNTFEFARVFHDFFMIGCITDVARRGEYALAKSIPHPYGAALCEDAYIDSVNNMKEHSIGARFRMNANEYIIASIVRHSRKSMSDALKTIVNNDEKCVFQVVIPEAYMKAAIESSKSKNQTEPPRFSQKDFLEAQRLHLQMYLGASPEQVNSRVYNVRHTDTRLFQILGGNSQGARILVDLICQNLIALVPLLNFVGTATKSIVERWMRGPARSIYQVRLGEDSYDITPGRGKVVGMGATTYPTPEKPMAVFSSRSVYRTRNSPSNMYGVTRYSMSLGHVGMLQINYLAASMRDVRYGPALEDVIELASTVDDSRNYMKTMQCSALKLVYMLAYPDIRQLFVLSGVIATRPPVRGGPPLSTASISHEWWPSFGSFICANMRFVPSFDITLVVDKGRKGMDCAEYRIDGFRASAEMIFNSISYGNNGRDVNISFAIDMATMIRCISHMPPVGGHGGGSVPPRDARVAFPINWSSPDVKHYASDMLNRAYSRSSSGLVGIRNLTVYSMAQSQSAKSICVIVGTDQIRYMPVISPHASSGRELPPISSGGEGASASCQVHGCRVAMEESMANKVTNMNMDAAERYRVVTRAVHESCRNIASSKTKSVDTPHGIDSLSTCFPINARVSVRVPDTFIDERTMVECAESIEITLSLENATYRNSIAEWMDLYGYWSSNAFEQARNLVLPTIDNQFANLEIERAKRGVMARSSTKRPPNNSGGRNHKKNPRARRQRNRK
jgi:hypothetical protein